MVNKETAAFAGVLCFAQLAAAQSNPATVDEASALLDRVAEAYRAAPALIDSVALVMDTPQGQTTVEFEYALGRGTDAYLQMNGFTVIASGDNVYVMRDDIAHNYMRLDLERDLESTIKKLFGPQVSLPLQFGMHARGGAAIRPDAFGLGLVGDARLDGHRTINAKDGSAAHELTFTADNGTITMHIDADTMLINGMRIEIQPPGAAPDDQYVVGITFDPRVLSNPPAQLMFEPGDRLRISKIDEFDKLMVGEPAPDFTLRTLDDRSVTLSQLRGSVVVLDFWATWCRPCMMALPRLQQFADWADDSGHPIEVYPVDVWERVRTDAEKKKKVGDLWNKKGFTMPTLLDLDSRVVRSFGFKSIPTTVVVAPDGKIFKIHVGFDRNLTTTLRRDTLSALGIQG